MCVYVCIVYTYIHTLDVVCVYQPRHFLTHTHTHTHTHTLASALPLKSFKLAEIAALWNTASARLAARQFVNVSSPLAALDVQVCVCVCIGMLVVLLLLRVCIYIRTRTHMS